MYTVATEGRRADGASTRASACRNSGGGPGRRSPAGLRVRGLRRDFAVAVPAGRTRYPLASSYLAMPALVSACSATQDH